MNKYKRILELPQDLRVTFNKWDEVREIYLSSCHCTSIMTDLEESLEVEALTDYCIDELCNNFAKLGFEELIYIPRESNK